MRTKNSEELQKQLVDLKHELNTLRVQAVAGSENATKSGAIRTVRKAIARVLTILSEQRKAQIIEKVGSSKRLPLALRAKQTRAMRRALTPEERKKTTLRQKKKAIHYPKLKYVLKP